MKKTITIIIILIMSLALYAVESVSAEVDTTEVKATLTFLELGSTTCIPCVQMEKVLETTREKYGDQLDIIFYDIVKDRSKAKEYSVRVMPTQVILNAEGEEIFRHIGFWPQEQVDEFMQKNGLTALEHRDE